MAIERGDTALPTAAAVAGVVERAHSTLQDALVHLEGLVDDTDHRPALVEARAALTAQVRVLLDQLRALGPPVLAHGDTAARRTGADDRWDAGYRAIIA